MKGSVLDLFFTMKYIGITGYSSPHGLAQINNTFCSLS